jgi:hypothetical protein
LSSAPGLMKKMKSNFCIFKKIKNSFAVYSFMTLLFKTFLFFFLLCAWCGVFSKENKAKTSWITHSLLRHLWNRKSVTAFKLEVNFEMWVLEKRSRLSQRVQLEAVYCT